MVRMVGNEVFQSITQSLRKMIRRQALPVVPLSPLNRQNRVRMLKRVRVIWIDGLLKQSLHHATRIELSLQDRPDVLANPWQLQYQELDQVPQTLPHGTTIVQVYDRAEGELLILGEPGAGKTTLLLELARTLLERANQDEGFPMPIVFNLSSWAEKRQPLHTWLVEELWTKYQVPRKIGKAWVEANQVPPLLDGLDEVAKDVRSACFEQINVYYHSMLKRRSSSIVVCCRSEEYVTLSRRTTLHHAVSILPLTDSQMNTYLEQAGEQVKGLRQALEEDPEPERRKVIAEALLRRRLDQMVHLHDEVFVDTSFVTCAEYQLFLDEQRAKGEEHHPDHWSTLTFPQGQGHIALLGMRPTDVSAFCQWLTERDAGAWHYRMPTMSEHRQREEKLQGTCNLDANTGYWVNEGHDFVWVGGKIPSFQLQGRNIRFYPFDLARILAPDLAPDLVSDLAPDLVSDFARVLTLDLDLALARFLALDFAHALNLGLARDLDPVLALDLYHVLDLDLDLDLTRVLDRVLTGIMAHITSGSRSMNVHALVPLARALVYSRALSRVLSFLASPDSRRR